MYLLAAGKVIHVQKTFSIKCLNSEMGRGVSVTSHLPTCLYLHIIFYRIFTLQGRKNSP